MSTERTDIKGYREHLERLLVRIGWSDREIDVAQQKIARALEERDVLDREMREVIDNAVKDGLTPAQVRAIKGTHARDIDYVLSRAESEVLAR